MSSSRDYSNLSPEGLRDVASLALAQLKKNEETARKKRKQKKRKEEKKEEKEMGVLAGALGSTNLEGEGLAAIEKPALSRKGKWEHKKGELEVDGLGEGVEGVKMGEEEKEEEL